MSKLKLICISNLQSWQGENLLELSPDGLNVLKADSETGKSTASRFLIKFCQGMKDYSEFIRYGSDYGVLIFEYEDGTITMFIAYPNSREIARYNENGELLASYTEGQITEKVLQSLGIIYDEKNEIVLNIFSRDLPMLFVSTPATFNGAVLARVLIDRDVEAALDNLKTTKERISLVLKNNSGKLPIIHKQCLELKNYDIDRLKQSKSEVQLMLPVIKVLKQLSDDVKSLKTKEADKQSLQVSKYNSEYITTFSKLLDSAESFRELMTEFFSKQVQLDRFGAVPISEQQIKELQNVVEQANSLDSKLKDYLDKKSSLTKAIIDYENAQVYLVALKEELGVCPLCGGMLDNDCCN